ncbi:murein DD-endopeptidase MepM [Parasalinivibrio latis]|uniref:murein DD-endopeptidase MepM n=1 Tax=Parasalinivibrio latis TaxID=2952610 RepID=UPI0030E42E35
MSDRENLIALTRRLPLNKKRILISLGLVVGAAVIWQPEHSLFSTPNIGTEHRGRVDINLADSAKVPLANIDSEPVGENIAPDDPALSVPKDDLDKQLSEDKVVQHSHTVSSGESLSSIFSQYGISNSELYDLTKAYPDVAGLRVGQDLSWTLDKKGELESLTIQRDRKTKDIYSFANDKINHEQDIAKGEFRPVILAGRVTSSFYQQARSAGLTPNQIQTLVKALQWRFDLGRQARKGDKFAVELSREYIDGDPVGSGDVQSLLYQSGNDQIFIHRNKDGKFYDADGHSLQRAFNRLPTAKRYRISSSFNPHRHHPITGRIAPHNGTDFAVPLGTPVLATGDGVVVKAQHHRLAGNFVVIKHGREYITRYLHLSKILVKPGQHVKMGQKIALSGNTGRSTGPHLHYELHKNNRPVNPMTVSLPQASPVPRSQLNAYEAEALASKQRLETDLNS